MNLKDIVKWNVRVSLLYAVGIWTMLGTYGYFQLEMKWKKKEQTDDPANGIVYFRPLNKQFLILHKRLINESVTKNMFVDEDIWTGVCSYTSIIKLLKYRQHIIVFAIVH